MNDEDRWQHVPYRTEDGDGPYASEVSWARLIRWVLVTAVVTVLVWWALSALVQHMREPEQERRVRACTAAMDADEDLRGPIPACEALSASQRREAAYRFARDRELF